ncbi:hypothetical protein [Bacillus sp. DX3.1]|uniref:hypothetical protein n=1 Tax=Bacillus sp. DX3.1 TaxID=3052091 RepID=UPI00257119AA|nr:hypothetical protein [Bacillus sp. DX3.1]WJE84499.1 hypothetical protein QRE67_27845 [Bacillus sp. DX3.1]
MDYSDLIPEDYVVRVIHDIVEQVSDDLFFSRYQGGGRSSYHPKMMTKVILYAYTQKSILVVILPNHYENTYQ